MSTAKGSDIKRVGIIFSGGPAPAANAVISSAASAFVEDGRQVVGFFHGYSNLQDYHPVGRFGASFYVTTRDRFAIDGQDRESRASTPIDEI